MYKSNIYPKLMLLVSFLVLGIGSTFSQGIETKLQLVDEDTWCVFATPTAGVVIDSATITGSGQITVVMPNGFQWNGLTSVSGLWQNNANVYGPSENATMQYISFGLVLAEPNYPIHYEAGVETNLFCFDRVDPCPDTIFLIDCGTPMETDPFCPNNSVNSNPGNDLSVIEFNTFPLYYNYTNNYAPSAWSCHDCDDDGVLNAFEDTNGNGVFDPGIDSSGICDPCDPFHVLSASLDYADGFDAICGGDVIDTAKLVVTIEGYWPPYSITLNNSATGDTIITNYYSGDTILVLPTASSTFTLVTVVDSFLCEIDPDSLFGAIGVDVHGPISITADPVDAIECSEDGVTFSATALNAGLDGTIYYKWQESTDGGSNYHDINDGSPYDDTDINTVSISPIAGLHGNYYRMKIWTDVCDTVWSAGALLEVVGPITPTSDPSNFIVCDDGTATFSGAGNNAGAVGTLLYQWQANDNVNGWLDVPTGNEPVGVTYSNANTVNLTINNADVGMDGWRFRLAIYTAECNRVFTQSGILDVEGPLAVTNHPDDISNCAGAEVFFIGEYDNPGGGNSQVTWEVFPSGGSGWQTVVNPVPAVYSGIQQTHNGTSATDTLTITNVVGLDGNQYRMRITTGTCSVIYSNAATLDVSGEVTFDTQPTAQNIKVCAGNDTIIVACATIPQGTFYYYWEFSIDQGATWDSLEIGIEANYDHTSNGALMSSGCDTLIIHDATGLQYHWYRAVAAATDCTGVPSTEARLLVEGPLSVDTQPVDAEICSGEPVTFSAEIANGGDSTGIITYQWQYSATGVGGWLNCALPTYAGAQTDEMTITDANGLHGIFYRLQSTTSDCGFLYTDVVELTVEGPISVTDQPDDVTLCYNDGTSFTAAATILNAGTLQYMWQLSSDGINWLDIDALPDFSNYTNYTTTTLNIASVNGLDLYCYRLAFYTNLCSRAFSDAGCLNIQGPLSITDQPDDVTECSEDDVQFAVDILNSSVDFPNELDYVRYRWQESTDSVVWTDLLNGLTPLGGSGVNGVTTDTLTVMETAGRDNHYFRVLVYSEFCDTLISEGARLFIEGPLTWTLMPEDTVECEGNGVTFTAGAVNAGLSPITYQWQISDDNGATYTDLSNGGTYTISGATTTTITYDTVGTDLQGDRIRLKAWTPYCDTIYSDYAQFIVHGEIGFSTHPRDTTACSGTPVCFDVSTFDSSGVATIQYRWQYSFNNGSSWLPLSNSSTYSGTNTDFLCISNISGLDSVQFRCRINTSECSFVYSNAALLVEEGPITFSDHPDDVTQCSAEAVTFEALAGILAGNSGVLEYQWQASSDGISFNNIPNGGGPDYAGVTTTTLTINNVTGLNGWHYRLRAKTGSCNNVFSFAGVLNVEGPLGIGLQPVDIQNCDDAEAIFLSQITNPADPAGLQTEYRWQILMPGGTWEDLINGEWNNGIDSNFIAGANSDTLLITPLTNLNGAYVRMKGWTGTCDTLTTDSALIAVEGPLTFTTQPEDVTLCSSSPVTFNVVAANSTGVGTIQYQWEESAGGVNWTNLTNSGVYSGVTTQVLTISNSTGLYNYKYRCKIRTGQCEYEFSQLAQLFVEGPITIDPEPVDTSICSNTQYIIDTEVSLPAASSGALNFRWQVSSDNGSNWSNLTDGQTTGTTNSYNGDVTASGQYFGTTSEDLLITLIEGLDGYMYRMLIWTSTCQDTTYEMTLTVLDACSTGTCDFDLDGDINDVDTDDDNDQLADWAEDYLTIANDTAGWNYLELDANGAPFVPNRPIDYSNCDTDSDNDGIQDNQEDPDGDEINNGEETDMDGIFDGDPLDPCDPILGPTCIGIRLAIDVYLQGGKIGNNISYPYPMRDNLREIVQTDTFIEPFPVVEPYTDIEDGLNNPSNPRIPFVHTGDGGNEEIDGGGSSILSIDGQDAVVDWIFVELRASTNLDSVITTRSALIQADGDIVDMDGVSDLTFINAPAGPYYVVVRHRNHLGIMTAEAMDLSPIVTEVDFTDPATPTYGNYGQIEINGVNYLWGGDFNANDRVVYQGPGNDINYLFSDIISDQVDRYLDPGSALYNSSYAVIANWIRTGYMRSDINIDGRCIYQGPGNDRQLMLFNTTLSHPLNDGHIANFVIQGTLP